MRWSWGTAALVLFRHRARGGRERVLFHGRHSTRDFWFELAFFVAGLELGLISCGHVLVQVDRCR